MKAIRIREPGGPEVLEFREAPDPRPAPDEVTVAIRAAGVNRADILQRSGRYPVPEGASPDIPGLEFAGEIVEVGSAVDGWTTGDRVMGLLGGGGYAERVAVPAGQLMRVPEALGWPEAGAIPEVFLTAADALFERGRLGAGDRVLIHSAGGGVGTAAIQLARASGASLVIGTASAGKLEGLRKAGLPIDVGVDYRNEAFDEVVLERTEGRGVDVILDTVGAPYWEANLRSLATLGRLVIVGVLGGGRVDEMDLRALMVRRATVVGTVLRARSAREKGALTAAFSERFLPSFTAAGGEAPRLRPVVDRVFPLADAAEAHRYVEGDRPMGKVILEVR